MKKQTIDAKRSCPQCGQVENQVKKGRNRSGTQRCKGKECGISYTLDPKKRAYPEEIRRQAIKTY